MPKPILVKVANTSEKSKIMRKRKPMKMQNIRSVPMRQRAEEKLLKMFPNHTQNVTQKLSDNE